MDRTALRRLAGERGLALGTCASMDHREVICLHVDVVRILGDRSQRGVLKRALETRSEFGYLGMSTTKTQAERVLRDAARFLEWVRRALSLREER